MCPLDYSVASCRQPGAKHIKERSQLPVHSLHACEHDTSLWSSGKLQRLLMEPADTQAEKDQRNTCRQRRCETDRSHEG